MSVPAKRRSSSRKRKGQSHLALKPKLLVTSGKQPVPHGFKKALDTNKKLKTRS